MSESPPGADKGPSPEVGEQVSDEELSNLISSFGNHEAKAITLLLMQPNVVYAKSDLHKLVNHAQGAKVGWQIDRSSPYGYCKNSLEPIGLVAKELTDDYGNKYGYVKTQYGEEKGEVLAALLLDFSNRHPDLSLLRLFGKTSSSIRDKSGEAVRAPRLRIKLLKALTEVSPLSTSASVAKRLEEPFSTASTHLKALSEAGILEYQSVDSTKPYSSYSIVDSTPPPLGEIEASSRYKTLVVQIYQIVSKDPSKKWTIEEVKEQVSAIRDLPSEAANKLDPTVSLVLMDLVRGGYVKVGIFHKYIMSTISINDDQKIVIDEIADILTRYQDQDPKLLKYGRGLVGKIRNDPNLIAELMKKAKTNSPDANRSDSDYVREAIISIVANNPEIDSRHIRETLEKDYETKKSLKWVQDFVKPLIAGGILTIHIKNGARKFRLSEEQRVEPPSAPFEPRN